MNRNNILEAMYEVIKESVGWGIDSKKYGIFVDGVVAMTEKMLVQVEIVERCEKLNKFNEKVLDNAKAYVDDNNRISAMVTEVKALPKDLKVYSDALAANYDPAGRA